MTENELRINGKSFDETISQLEEFMESDDVHGELFAVLRSARDFMENLNEEIQQYRAIGTIDEFKALKEKDEPAKVIEHETPHFVHWQCGNCGAEFYSGQKFCDECGHPADWGDLLK